MSVAGTPEPPVQPSSGYGAYVPGRSGRPAADQSAPVQPGAYPGWQAPADVTPAPYAPAARYAPSAPYPTAATFAGAPGLPQLRRGPDGTAVMRPSGTQIWRSVRAIAPVFLGAVVIMVVRRGAQPALPIAAVGVVLGALYVLLELRRSRIVVTPLGLERVRILGRVSFPLADVGQVLLFPFRAERGADRSTYLTALVRDRSGRKLLTVRSDVWAPEDVRALAGSLGVVPTQFDKVFTPRELEAAFPGTVPYIQRHPMAVAVLVTVVLVVTVGIGVVLVNQ